MEYSASISVVARGITGLVRQERKKERSINRHSMKIKREGRRGTQIALHVKTWRGGISDQVGLLNEQMYFAVLYGQGGLRIK